MAYRWMKLDAIEPAVSEMRRRGVSRVARSRRGFLTAFRRAGGSPRALTPWWRRRRNNFVARHVAQAQNNNEPWWDAKGRPTRRHLALVAWAYTPTPRRWRRYLSKSH